MTLMTNLTSDEQSRQKRRLKSQQRKRQLKTICIVKTG